MTDLLRTLDEIEAEAVLTHTKILHGMSQIDSRDAKIILAAFIRLTQALRIAEYYLRNFSMSTAPTHENDAAEALKEIEAVICGGEQK